MLIVWTCILHILVNQVLKIICIMLLLMPLVTCYNYTSSKVDFTTTVCVQIFEVRNFRGWRIFAILFSRIAFQIRGFIFEDCMPTKRASA